MATNAIIGGAAAYTTAQGTYVVFKGNGGHCPSGQSAEAIVWSVGAEGDNRLNGFDGDTGRIVYNGGGPSDVIGSVRRYQTPIHAGGHIFVAADNTVKAFMR